MEQEKFIEDYNAQELKDYVRGLCMVPLSKFSQEDRRQLRYCKDRLSEVYGIETVVMKYKVVFHKR